MTQREFHEVLTSPEGESSVFQNVVMIQCVGSRNEAYPYCSRIFCTQAVTNGVRMKKANPDSNISILFRDMRTFAQYELLYKEAREAGIQFFRYEPEKSPELFGQRQIREKINFFAANDL